MFRTSNIIALIALTVGAGGGWAYASGKFDSLLSSGVKATAATTTTTPCPADGCCANPDKAACWSAIDVHNRQVAAAGKTASKPNILVIMGDDIGIPQLAPTRGTDGLPHTQHRTCRESEDAIHRLFGHQSCTTGRASFILYKSRSAPDRWLIGMPGDPHGITEWMPTIADVMKSQEATRPPSSGRKCLHLGDQDKHLPTNHGFDEFFGNLYHLNAEEEPEGYFPRRTPEFKKKYGPRGVILPSPRLA